MGVSRVSNSHWWVGRIPQPQFRAEILRTIPLTLGAEKYQMSGCIMRGNSACSDWLRLPSLYKWPDVDIWVICCLSECRDLDEVLCQWPWRSQVTGDGWMSFLSLWRSRASGLCSKQTQHSASHDKFNSTKDSKGPPPPPTHTHTLKHTMLIRLCKRTKAKINQRIKCW